MEEYNQMWQELGLNLELHHELLMSVDRSFQQTVGAQQNRPQSMGHFDQMLHASHGGRVRELLDSRAKGNKTVGTFCIYVPDEIAMAVDVIPIPLCGGTQFSIPYCEQRFPRDICPLLKSTLGLAFSKTCPYAGVKSMAVGETTCDAKKKTWDILAGMVNFHVMELPQKKDEIDHRLWYDAVWQFKDKIEGLAEKPVEPEGLAAAIRIMNDKRRALQQLTELRKNDPPPISGLDALLVMQMALNADHVHFTDCLNRLNDEIEERLTNGNSPFLPGVRRVMISGCPSVMGNWKVHALIEQAGAAVVMDETCTGTRYFEHLVDETATDLDGQMSALADRYMKINCACFTPNEERIQDVVRKAQDHKADGVVEYVLQYCHCYNIEALRVESALKVADIPYLKVVTDYSEEDTGQLRTRIEAFLERLS